MQYDEDGQLSSVDTKSLSFLIDPDDEVTSEESWDMFDTSFFNVWSLFNCNVDWWSQLIITGFLDLGVIMDSWNIHVSIINF